GQGRFGDPPSDALWAFTASVGFDKELATDDVAGSRAHVRMLREVGLLTDDEAVAIDDALATVARELDDGTFRFVPRDEDIHTAVERRVTELAGEAGAKLPTGRGPDGQGPPPLPPRLPRARAPAPPPPP